MRLQTPAHNYYIYSVTRSLDGWMVQQLCLFTHVLPQHTSFVSTMFITEMHVSSCQISLSLFTFTFHFPIQHTSFASTMFITEMHVSSCQISLVTFTSLSNTLLLPAQCLSMRCGLPLVRFSNCLELPRAGYPTNVTQPPFYQAQKCRLIPEVEVL